MRKTVIALIVINKMIQNDIKYIKSEGGVVGYELWVMGYGLWVMSPESFRDEL